MPKSLLYSLFAMKNTTETDVSWVIRQFYDLAIVIILFSHYSRSFIGNNLETTLVAET